MKVVCVGDSFVRGFGVNEDECWVSILNRDIENEFINKGISGDTSGGTLARFYTDVVAEKPRYVLISGGFNDFLAGADLGTVQANIMALAHQAYGNNIVPVIIIEPDGNAELFKKNWPAFADIDEIQRKMVDYRYWLIKFCEGFSIFYIDLNKELSNSHFKNNNYIDGIHMNAEGHKMVADIIRKYFEI